MLNTDSLPAPPYRKRLTMPSGEAAKGMADASVTTLGSKDGCPGVGPEADRSRGI